MKKKLFQIIGKLSILGIIALNIPVAYAGGDHSKPKSTYQPPLTKEQNKIISNPLNHPECALDGGKAYFNAWNDFNNGKNFKIFLKEYSNVIENSKSAKLLTDSERNEEWRSYSNFGNLYELLSWEAPDKINSGKYFLRVDTENKIVYTIRKSGDSYLCKFYIIAAHKKNPLATLRNSWIISNSSLKNLLLPIDRELISEP